MRFAPLCALWFLAACGAAEAAPQRAFRRLGPHDGLPVLPVYGIGQDATGYLWLATQAGVGRYDGVRFKSWSERPPRDRPASVITGSDGEVFVADQGGALWRVAGLGLLPVAGPDGAPLSGVEASARGSDGTLWVARGGALLARRAQQWSNLVTIAGETIRHIVPIESGGALVAARAGVYRVTDDGAARLIDLAEHVLKVVPLDGDAYARLSWEKTSARVIEVDGASRRSHAVVPGRPIDLVRRGRHLWVSTDRHLARLHSSGAPEVMGPSDGLASGGPLLVDREGSLWLGSYLGLMQFPEPDTILLDDRAGLPSAHALYLNAAREGLWISTWQGSALVSEDGRGMPVLASPTRRIGRGCVDAGGVLWSVSADFEAGRFALLERRAEGEVAHAIEGLRWVSSCAAADDGGLWIASNLGLLRASPRGGRPIRVSEPPASGRPESDPDNRRVFEDSEGRLWLGRGRSICHSAARVVPSDERSWSCQTVETMRHVMAFLEPAAGVLWVATAGGGVLRLQDESWHTIPASTALPSPDVNGLSASRSGGIWVVSHATTLRVEDRPDLPDGWQVLETLDAWHGVPEGGREDLLELPDGTVWITTMLGAVRVPRDARRPHELPPRVELAELLVDGRPLAHTSSLRLAHDRNRLELHFSALSFRDPGLIRYRMRSRGHEAWSDPLRSPFVRFADLAPGPHRLEVAASLDRTNWSPAPAVLEFEVDPPWFAQPWALALFGSLAAAAVYAAHRARVSSLLRLERQRSRIARDLHDEMGSGLGSVGILAEVAAGDGIDEQRRRALCAQVAETAGELGTALDDIVWSLRSGAATLATLAAELAAQGRRLFPEGRAAFHASFPEPWPDVRLSPPAGRNVQRIAIEALHNAARHAAAHSVTLSLEPLGRRWRLRVRDDGNGLPSAAAPPGNGGMSGMRKRAAQIGAELTWEPADGCGTVVTLDFDPAARGQEQDE
jgi:signal transduction histidine kinase/ligand-binding sensor domain-containing protein